MQIAKPERKVRSPFGQYRKPQSIMNEWPNDALDLPPTWWLFYLVCEPGPEASEGWVTGGLIQNRVTEEGCPLKKSPCHYQKPLFSKWKGATLHSLINDCSSNRERKLLPASAGLSFLFPFRVKCSPSPYQSQPKQGLVLI